MVRSQAQTMRPATPQRTADRRRVAPTPTIAPVMVWVVETGTPRKVARTRGQGAERDGRVGGEHDPGRDRQVAVRLQLEVAGADQQGADDAHRLLGVVAA